MKEKQLNRCTEWKKEKKVQNKFQWILVSSFLFCYLGLQCEHCFHFSTHFIVLTLNKRNENTLHRILYFNWRNDAIIKKKKNKCVSIQVYVRVPYTTRSGKRGKTKKKIINSFSIGIHGRIREFVHSHSNLRCCRCFTIYVSIDLLSFTSLPYLYYISLSFIICYSNNNNFSYSFSNGDFWSVFFFSINIF